MKVVLDAYALLAWLQGEPGAAVVRSLLSRAESGKAWALASSINIGEVYYRLRKAGDEEGAEEFLHDLRGGVLPIEVVPATNRRVWAAAGLKARYAISYADAFAASLAAETGAPVVTGDPEFKSLAEDGIVQVKWLPQPGRAAPQRRT